ncbi:hypothetical protein GE061_003901 [Apolygus lucorum]|uniref:Uncharacterized protein n=1 Tax=Apolygus lucorum TaxID=248454 RepID=A0A8S9WX46_APOLU|nr:hypothetical protein GE061_003901 [Apolygus lucorum]
MEVKRSSEENKVGLLTPQESLSRRNGSISGKKSARQPQFKTRRKRPLLNIIKNKGGNDASSQRSRSENSRVPGRERDVFVRGRHSSSSQYQEATGSEFYNDAVIDRRRHQGDNIFHHYRHQSEHAEMGATQFQEALQSQSRRGGMEESYGRRPPFLGEASQEVLSHRGERFRRPPLLEDPPIPRQAVNQWEQGPRNYCNIGQEIKVIESPFPRDSRRPQPARTSSTINIERINDSRRSPWASEGTPEETRRWTFPFAAQHRPQEPQRSHQERRLLTPRRHLEDERCRRLS